MVNSRQTNRGKIDVFKKSLVGSSVQPFAGFESNTLIALKMELTFNYKKTLRIQVGMQYFLTILQESKDQFT